MLKNATARRRAGITYSNAQMIKKAANYYHSIIMIRCVSGDNISLNKALYETKGYHIKAKSCNFGPMKEFVAANPKFSKLSFSQGGYKKQKKLLENSADCGAGTTELYISWARIKELLADNIISRTEDCTPESLKKTEHEPDKKTIAVKATLVNTPGKGKVDKSITEIINYVYYLSTVDKDHDNPKAMYKVFYAESVLKKPKELNVLTNPQFNNNFDQQKSVISLDPDSFNNGNNNVGNEHLKAVVADYDLFGIWTNIEDDYLKHYSHQLGGREYLLRFARCVPGAGMIYDISNINTFSNFEDPEVGNVSANLIKISKAINGIDNIDGAAPVDQDIQQVDNAYHDYMLRKFIHHNDETGRPGVSEIDLPIYVVIPDEYTFSFGRENQLYIETEEDFFKLFNNYKKRPEFLLELNPGWEDSISDKLEAHNINFNEYKVIPGADNINSQYRNDQNYGQERMKYISNRAFNGVRQGDSERYALGDGEDTETEYYNNTFNFRACKEAWVNKLRAGTLFSENNYEYSDHI
ncbi:MAG: CyaA/EF/ExoY family adenylyl cyclase toxin [Fibrobacterales bacterium]